jgi:hypothetical protein
MTSLRKLVALFLLAWMPLQALAVPLLAWHCASHEQGRVMAQDEVGDVPCQAHGGPGMAATPPAGDEPAQDAGTSTKSGDFCCSHFSAVPPALVVAAVERVPFEAPVAPLPAFSFLSRPLIQPPRV